jgi:hypothetical protein
MEDVSVQLLDRFEDALVIPEVDERAARRTLRAQIARLEAELADAFVTAFRGGGVPLPQDAPREPRVLGLGELEQIRDDLAERLRAARITISERADEVESNRIAFEKMLLEPAKHPYERVSLKQLGEPGCGVYQVRPRMGLIGMLRGWWVLKLSSGCPLAGGRGVAPRPAKQPG